ncbi:MAG: ABC transporter ATP-binding protein [Carbonactinosporaceae bacterium]
MNENSNLIETRGLTKRYGQQVTAVDDVALTVRRGEVYGFLGPNGAGKTTTLRMLVGLIRPTTGKAVVLGRPPGHPEGLARLGAFIETPAFYPYLSGRDNLRALARMSGIPDQRVDFSLDLVTLSGRGRDRFATYSLGMKQRLAVAAALLKDPELLILDEPTNGLDPAGMRDMRGLIRDLGTGGYTVLLSSHLLGEVQQICDRVGVIARGRLVAEGSVDELRGHAVLHVVAEPLDRARALVARLAAPGEVTVRDGALRLNVDGIDPGSVNRTLVEAGLHVTELRRVENSLEDVFFELTGTKEDVDVR